MFIYENTTDVFACIFALAQHEELRHRSGTSDVDKNGNTHIDEHQQHVNANEVYTGKFVKAKSTNIEADADGGKKKAKSVYENDYTTKDKVYWLYIHLRSMFIQFRTNAHCY